MNNSLYQKLKNEVTSVSLKEIEQILDEELQKDIDEIDTELVELCVNLLTLQENSLYVQNIIPSTPSKNRRIHSAKLKKKLLLVAATVTLLCTSLISGAKGQSIKYSSGITDPPEDSSPLRIYHSPGESSAEHLSELSAEKKDSPLGSLLYQNGFHSFTLPQFLFIQDVEILKQYFYSSDLCISAEIHLNYQGQIIRITINQYASPEIFTITDDYYNASQSTKIEKDNITLDVVHHDCSNESILAYSSCLKVYRISFLDCSYEDALSYAENF